MARPRSCQSRPAAHTSHASSASLNPMKDFDPGERYWFAMGDQDLFYPNPVMADGMYDWVLSAERMAKVLADKGYHYQFVFARNSKHVDRPTVAQTFPAALEWLWKGYPIP
jgi:hypothetical protein